MYRVPSILYINAFDRRLYDRLNPFHPSSKLSTKSRRLPTLVPSLLSETNINFFHRVQKQSLPPDGPRDETRLFAVGNRVLKDLGIFSTKSSNTQENVVTVMEYFDGIFTDCWLGPTPLTGRTFCPNKNLRSRLLCSQSPHFSLEKWNQIPEADDQMLICSVPELPKNGERVEIEASSSSFCKDSDEKNFILGDLKSVACITFIIPHSFLAHKTNFESDDEVSFHKFKNVFLAAYYQTSFPNSTLFLIAVIPRKSVVQPLAQNTSIQVLDRQNQKAFYHQLGIPVMESNLPDSISHPINIAVEMIYLQEGLLFTSAFFEAINHTTLGFISPLVNKT